MSPSASEYAWFEDNELRSMYCMTYIKGRTPREFLARLGVTPYPDQEGLRGLSSTHWTDPLDMDDHWQFIGDIEHPVQWEVEALEPDELQRLVLAAVDPYIDHQVLAQQTARQEEQRRALASFVRGWGAPGGASA